LALPEVSDLTGSLCQCDPSAKTNKAISALNHQQRDHSIKPQCDIKWYALRLELTLA
jgi:hypothetical protein